MTLLYAILADDAPDSLPARAATRDSHLERVQALRHAGRLVIAGPHPALDTREPGEAGYTGSLIIAEFPSLEEARAWAQADPYVTAGVWRQISVRPLIQVLP